MGKIKEHLAQNKEIYIGVGIGLSVAVITLLIVKKYNLSEKVRINGHTKEELRAVLHKGADGRDVATTGSFSLFNNATFGDHANPVTVIHTGDKGHPGFLTKSLETGAIYTTQGEAARDFNIAPNVMSLHLNGRIPDAKGLHFERVPVAA